MISQNNHEIFLIIAEYDNDYLDYRYGQREPQSSFGDAPVWPICPNRNEPYEGFGGLYLRIYFTTARLGQGRQALPVVRITWLYRRLARCG